MGKFGFLGLEIYRSLGEGRSWEGFGRRNAVLAGMETWSELRPIMWSEGISARVELYLARVELLGPSWVR